MPFRFIVILATSMLCTTGVAQDNLGAISRSTNDPFSNMSRFRNSGHTSSLSGLVRSFDGRPLPDARIEIHNTQTGQMIASGYTNNGGAFEIPNLPNGVYDVVVTVGLNESHERVTVEGADAMISVRVAQQWESSDVGDRNSVSVAQMKIPERARNAYKKAVSAARKQKLDEAQKYAADALVMYPDYADALTLRGILELEANQLQQASGDLEKAIHCDSNYTLAYFALGAVYNTTSHFDDAIRALERGIGLNPTSWQGYFELGKAFLGKANYEAALRQLNKAEGMAPKYAPVHLVKAHALLGMKDYSSAMAELEAYLERDPKGAQSAQARQTLDKVRTFAASSPK